MRQRCGTIWPSSCRFRSFWNGRRRRPECYVLLEKLSAKEREGIGKASFAMQSVSGSLYAAAQLSGMVRAAMAQAVVLPEISRASLANEYNFTDPTTRTYRYQAVFELTYYEGEI